MEESRVEISLPEQVIDGTVQQGAECQVALLLIDCLSLPVYLYSHMDRRPCE